MSEVNLSRILLFFILILYPAIFFAQVKNYRPELFFREDWKESPAEIPVSQNHIKNPELLLNLYGPARDSLKKSHHDTPADDPYYVWSGLCNGTWAITLKSGDYLADMTGFSKIRWRAKQSGFRKLYPIIKLLDGTWLIGDLGDGASGDWRIREFNIQDVQWHGLNIETVTEGNREINPDLSKVDEIGFTDLMPGGASVACSRLDWIEVYAIPVVR